MKPQKPLSKKEKQAYISGYKKGIEDAKEIMIKTDGLFKPLKDKLRRLRDIYD